MTNYEIVKTYTEEEFAKWIIGYIHTMNKSLLETFLNYWLENNIITEELKNTAIVSLENSHLRTQEEAINNWTKMLKEEHIDE